MDFSLYGKKGNVRPRTGHEGPEEAVEVQLYSSLNFGTRWGWMNKATPRQLNAREGDPRTHCTKGWVGSLSVNMVTVLNVCNYSHNCNGNLKLQ